ncbi:MAG: hypothetical protein ACJ0GJ_01995 [Candidatus Actinomarina sp.]|jgi:uncharacterized protein YlxW (UPF0749 family)|tara:strand:- start:78 stop:278 length:201 start_codon:yes stop_codon:yes gene_type:complete
MKNDDIELLEKLLNNIYESENKLKNFIENLNQKLDNGGDLDEISESLEKTLNQLRDLNDKKFSEEE